MHPAIAARLDDDGQRYTSGRRKLVEVLVGAGRPLTAAEVLTESDLAQSSAYRNLAVLEACGVVHRVAGSDEFARFELAEDLTDHHHHHLICRRCGLTVAIAADDVEQWAQRVASDHGFTDARHVVDVFGLCSTCSRAS